MSRSFKEILDRMKSMIETAADRREGTWTADNLQAVANELARIYEEDIDTILPQAFVMTAGGRNLDSCCSDYGIMRRAATRAEAVRNSCSREALRLCCSLSFMRVICASKRSRS